MLDLKNYTHITEVSKNTYRHSEIGSKCYLLMPNNNDGYMLCLVNPPTANGGGGEAAAAVSPTEPQTSQPVSIESDLRLLVIADCHHLTEEEAAKLAGLKYDLCFLLGDINENYLKMILKHIPKEKTYGIHGNHDEHGLLESLNIPNIHLKTIEHNGIKILGYEGSPCYKRGAYVMHTQEEAQQDLEQAPAADILISHEGPYKLYSESVSRSGFLGITEYLTARAVPLNIHGHQHINSHKRHGATDIICIYRAALIDLANSTIQNIF